MAGRLGGVGVPAGATFAALGAAGQQHGTLIASLRHAADMYRKQAGHQAMLVHTYLPVLMMLVLGGGVTVLYVLLLMGPWVGMLHGLARP